MSSQANADTILASPHVNVKTNVAGGSATYIGNGYFLTANHVVYDATTLAVFTNKGDKVAVEIVSSNALLDFAILRVIGPANVNLTPVGINCDLVPVGTAVKLHGNPGGDFNNLSFVYTKGEVIGSPINLANVWFNVVPVDATVIWGMSGGGAINDAGEYVGLIVAVHIANRQAVGFGYIVPTPLICAQIIHEGIDLS